MPDLMPDKETLTEMLDALVNSGSGAVNDADALLRCVRVYATWAITQQIKELDKPPVAAKRRRLK
jgi:hypothetical protein